MHETAEYGVAAHWRYKEGGRRARGSRASTRPTSSSSGSSRCSTGRATRTTRREFTEHLRGELIEDEVYVFTPKGEVKSLAAGATPLDFAYEIHTDVGHRCVGAKVNGKIVPLHYELRPATSSRSSPPSASAARRATGWRSSRRRARATRSAQWFKAESRDDSEHTGRELLQEHLTKAGLPAQKHHRLAAARRRDPRDGLPQGRRLLHRARRREDLAEGRRQQGPAAAQAGRERRGRGLGRRRPAQADDPPQAGGAVVEVRHPRRGRRRRPAAAGQVLPPGVGRPDPRLRLARPRHHDPPRGLPERGRAAQGPRALRAGVLGRRQRDRRSRSRSRSTRGTATACSRTSRARSPRAASTSSRRTAASSTRWSRTAS